MTQCTDCAHTLSGDEPDEPSKWAPDEQLIPAILAGTTKYMRDLRVEDRCWAVAGLKLGGLTADEIAMRMDCSRRLVRAIAAMPLTTVCTYALVETQAWHGEKRLAEQAVRQRDGIIVGLREEVARTRDKLSRMIDNAIVGTPSCGRCGTPWDKGNTYWNNGKRYCRECNRRKQKAFRDARKGQESEADVTDPGGYDSVIR